MQLLYKTKSYLALSVLSVWVYGCTPKKADQANTTPPKVSINTIHTAPATIKRTYTGNIEGANDIDIHPQIEGYLVRIFVDEGSFVRKGQPLFEIAPRPFNEVVNTSEASLKVAEAEVQELEIEVNRLRNLVNGKVISPTELQQTEAKLNAAKASVQQNRALNKAAVINKNFTSIKAPFDGFIGRIPYKVGSLVGSGEQETLTRLSSIHTIRFYFSMSEQEFLSFKKRYAGNSLQEKICNVPPLALRLPDNSIYPHTGKLEMIQGQFDRSTNTITFRASFPNPNGLLRSGNTGVIILDYTVPEAISIPQTATFFLQNKTFVMLLDKDNRISNKMITILDKDTANYIVESGLTTGDSIVAKGLERLKEGMQVIPDTKQ